MPLLSTFGAASARSFGGIGAAAAGAGLDIDEAFSTFVYDGSSSGQTITNNIDLSGEGGLVWIKSRTSADTHLLFDTARGTGKYLISHDTSQEATNNQLLTAFNSNGFSLGTDFGANDPNQRYVSWTFRAAKGFADVVKITGDGTSGRNISHNLGQKPGMIIGTRYDANFEHWHVYHRSLDGGNQPATHALRLNSTNAEGDESSYWNDTEPTSTQFTVGNNLNHNGGSFIFYLFAHNNSDGGFGPDSDQDVIKCGSYTGNASGTGPEINLGFEPQWLLVKNAGNSSSDWLLLDVMRGWGMGDADIFLEPNTSGADQGSQNWVDITPTGFKITNANGQINGSGENHIYMAIRRGPLAEPTSGTDVFATGVVQNNTRKTLTNPLGHPSDWAFLQTSSGGNWIVQSRLTESADLKFNSSAAEVDNKGYGFANNTNYEADGTAAIGAYGWNFRRAPGYFDIATYNGNAQASAITVNHNLGVVPEMMWCKKRGATGDWMVYHKDLNGGTNPHTYRLRLNSTGGEGTGSGVWNAAPTATQFSVGTDSDVNADANIGFITYLFATVAGVSKVGSYTGTGSSNITVDCGFSSGARFVLIKRTDASGTWWIADTARGLVSGNDKLFELNSTAAELTGYNMVEPSSSGFIVNGGANKDNSWNDSGGSYIFYAIA